MFECVKDPADLEARKHGIIVNPTDARLSIAEKLRVYSSSDDDSFDPVKYKVEGRGGPKCYRINNLEGIDDIETFRLIKKGDLSWVNGTSRNEFGANITSSYSAGDSSKTFTEVSLENLGLDGPAECRDYRITFSYTRLDAAAAIKVGEVELVGKVDDCATSTPTTSPSS